MNPRRYAERAFELSPVFGGRIPLDQEAAIVIRYGYPDPGAGVTLFELPREKAEWGLDHFRKAIEQLIAHVAGECLAVVEDADADDESKRKIKDAIRRNFEMS